MRKAFKIFIVFFTVLIMVIFGGWLWIKGQLNDIVSSAKDINRNSGEISVDEWFDSSIDSANVNLSEVQGKSGEVVGEGNETSGQEFLIKQNQSAAKNDDPKTLPVAKEQPQINNRTQKLQLIKEKYKGELIILQGEYENQLNTLLSSAKVEYQRIKDNGSKAEIASLAKRYIDKGKKLESECDRKFNSITGSMEVELKRNGFSTAIVEAVKDGYEGAKSERRRQLMGKALNYL